MELTLGTLKALFITKNRSTFENYLRHILQPLRGVRSFIAAMQTWLREKLFLKSQIKKIALLHFFCAKRKSRASILFSSHHQSHAATVYQVPLKAVILCMDG